jgi:hypothetical protein
MKFCSCQSRFSSAGLDSGSLELTALNYVSLIRKETRRIVRFLRNIGVHLIKPTQTQGLVPGCYCYGTTLTQWRAASNSGHHRYKVMLSVKKAAIAMVPLLRSGVLSQTLATTATKQCFLWRRLLLLWYHTYAVACCLKHWPPPLQSNAYCEEGCYCYGTTLPPWRTASNSDQHP